MFFFLKRVYFKESILLKKKKINAYIANEKERLRPDIFLPFHNDWGRQKGLTNGRPKDLAQGRQNGLV